MQGRDVVGNLACLTAWVLVGLITASVNAAAQPVAFAIPKPAPNDQGWFNSPVRLEYACARATFCPESEVRDTEGAEQEFAAVARDADGAEATVSGLLNIDYTAPAVVIESPAQGYVTSNALLRVAAQVSDALSGAASATCNGMPASLSATGRIQCMVLLVDGLNDIAVEASDRAGNSGSAGLRVLLRGTPSRLRIVPEAAGVLVASTRSFQVLDEFGVVARNVVWQVDAPARAHISDDGRHVLTARQEGAVVLTASADGLTATARVTIHTGDRLPSGTIHWKVDTLSVVQTPDTKPLTFSERNLVSTSQAPGGVASVESINQTTGHLNWRMRPAARTGERIATVREQRNGGALMVIDADKSTGSSLVRSGGFTQGTPWRYRSAGKIGADVAMHTDSGISFMETMPDGFSRFVAMTGDHGVVAGRIPLPSGVHLALNVACAPGAHTARELPAQVGPITGTPTNVVFPMVVSDDREDFARCGGVSGTLLRTLYLATIGDGPPKVEHVRVYNAPAGSVPPVLSLFPVSLDGHGGLLMAWTVAFADSGIRESRVVRFSESGRQEYALPTAGKIWLAGKNNDAIMTDGNRLVVFNVLTGEVRWNHFYPTGVRIVSVKDGEIIMQTKDQEGAYDTDGRPIPKRP